MTFMCMWVECFTLFDSLSWRMLAALPLCAHMKRDRSGGDISKCGSFLTSAQLVEWNECECQVFRFWEVRGVVEHTAPIWRWKARSGHFKSVAAWRSLSSSTVKVSQTFLWWTVPSCVCALHSAPPHSRFERSICWLSIFCPLLPNARKQWCSINEEVRNM